MSIRIILVVSFVCIAVLPIIVIGSVDMQSVTKVLEREILLEEENHLLDQEDVFIRMLHAAKSQALLLGGLPSIQGIIRSKETGVDSLDGSTVEEWKDRLALIFTRLLEVEPEIRHIEYLDVRGNEIVRVNDIEGVIERVPEGLLQNKSDIDYFEKINTLSSGEFYVSSLDLNQEFGQIERPFIPVLRFGTPIFDEVTGARSGMVVFNIDMQSFLDTLGDTLVGHRILTDENGYFILHPDEEKEFSLTLQTRYNYFKEQPELIANTEQLDFRNHHDVEGKEYRIWRKIFYDAHDEDAYWIIFTVVEEKELFTPITQIRNQLLAVSAVMILLVVSVAILLADILSAPIRKLTEGVEEIAKRNLNYRVNVHKMRVGRKSELGRLTIGFNHMADQIQQYLEKSNAEKEGKNSDREAEKEM